MSVISNNIKTATEINSIREAAKVSTEIMHELRGIVAPGATPADIDNLMENLCTKHAVVPAFKGVANSEGGDPFPANLCVCVNDQILHAIPSHTEFRSGDLVKIDMGIISEGFYTDHCTTVAVKELLPADEALIKVGKFAVDSAVNKVSPNATTGDLGNAMYSVASLGGLDVLKDYVGHGIGTQLWEPPQIPAFGQPGTGVELKTGMIISVEAQVVSGSDQVYTESDDWTVKTVDGGKGVMFEYMVLVTGDGREILTDTQDWPLVV